MVTKAHPYKFVRFRRCLSWPTCLGDPCSMQVMCVRCALQRRCPPGRTQTSREGPGQIGYGKQCCQVGSTCGACCGHLAHVGFGRPHGRHVLMSQRVCWCSYFVYLLAQISCGERISMLCNPTPVPGDLMCECWPPRIWTEPFPASRASQPAQHSSDFVWCVRGWEEEKRADESFDDFGAASVKATPAGTRAAAQAPESAEPHPLWAGACTARTWRSCHCRWVEGLCPAARAGRIARVSSVLPLRSHCGRRWSILLLHVSARIRGTEHLGPLGPRGGKRPPTFSARGRTALAQLRAQRERETYRVSDFTSRQRREKSPRARGQLRSMLRYKPRLGTGALCAMPADEAHRQRHNCVSTVDSACICGRVSPQSPSADIVWSSMMISRRELATAGFLHCVGGLVLPEVVIVSGATLPFGSLLLKDLAVRLRRNGDAPSIEPPRSRPLSPGRRECGQAPSLALKGRSCAK